MNCSECNHPLSEHDGSRDNVGCLQGWGTHEDHLFGIEPVTDGCTCTRHGTNTKG